MTDEAPRLPACRADELARAGKRVVELNGVPVLLMWYDGKPVALHDTCIHRGRSLSDAVVFAGRLVCAGHQWAFDLESGYCKARDRYQPTYAVTVEHGTVYVAVPSVDAAAAESAQVASVVPQPDSVRAAR